MWKTMIFLLFSLFFMANAKICRDGFTLVNNKCLMLMPVETSMGSHGLYCYRLGGNLVSIRTAIDNTAIAKLAMANGTFQKIWIGLICYGNNPANCIWDDQLGNASSYNNFQPGNPRIDIGNCVYMIPSTGKWVSGNCNTYENSSAICETDMIGACSHKFGDNCYFPILDAYDHDEALNICEQMCGGSLVSIHSAEENAFVFEMFISGYLSIFIGAMLSNEGTNYWSDGTPWDFHNFNHSSINDGRYYYMSRNDGKWNSDSSEASMSVICKWKASSTCQPPCTEHVYRPETGTISSPSYPWSYNKYRGVPPCYYVLHVPNGLAAIWFDDIFLDSSSSIELYSGTGNSTPMAVITQKNQYDYRSPLTFPSQLIKLVFNQCQDNCDVTNTYRWSAQFGTNYGSECGQIFNTSAVISSKNYPNNYPNNYKCTYYVQNLGGHISFHFDHFQTEQGHDFVSIYDQESGTLLYSFSGGGNTGNFYPYHQSLRIEFTTDGSNTFSGWSARFWSW